MAQSRKLNLFYEYQKGLVRRRGSRTRNWIRTGRIYICSICKAELLSKLLLLEHKRSNHAY